MALHYRFPNVSLRALLAVCVPFERSDNQKHESVSESSAAVISVHAHCSVHFRIFRHRVSVFDVQRFSRKVIVEK